MKFARKQAVPIEATQFQGIKGGVPQFNDGSPFAQPVPRWLQDAMLPGTVHQGGTVARGKVQMVEGGLLVVGASAGTFIAAPDDWIVWNDGGFDVIEPAEFAATYEPAE